MGIVTATAYNAQSSHLPINVRAEHSARTIYRPRLTKKEGAVAGPGSDPTYRLVRFRRQALTTPYDSRLTLFLRVEQFSRRRRPGPTFEPSGPRRHRTRTLMLPRPFRWIKDRTFRKSALRTLIASILIARPETTLAQSSNLLGRTHASQHLKERPQSHPGLVHSAAANRPLALTSPVQSSSLVSTRSISMTAAQTNGSQAADADADPAPDSPKYHPYRLPEPSEPSDDWIHDVDLDVATVMAAAQPRPLRFLVLYGSLRKTSYSRFLAFEMARLLEKMGADVRVFDPSSLPVKHDMEPVPEAVTELRALSLWSDGHVWVSPEQHGQITAAFKNQIDWIPLSTGSVRPTQGRTLGLAMVSGGSQSFNTINSLRILGRWMRMFTIPNQSSVPQAYTFFTDKDADEGGSRLMAGGNRDRLVDCAEEFVKYTLIMRPHFALLSD